jgi:molecular chaperone GrpE (heat shock protein)
MSDDEGSIAADRILAGLDFATAASARDAAHRQQMEQFLRGVVELVDALDALNKIIGISAPTDYAPTVAQILRKALRLLREAGVEPIEALGKPVDLDRSEIVAVIDDEEAPPDTVAEEIVRAYAWRERLLRRAKVVVTRQSNQAETH